MTKISIHVDAETAQAFSQASAEDRQKLELLLRLRLRELVATPARPINEIMNNMSHEANERGLTAETLQSLLNAPRIPL